MTFRKRHIPVGVFTATTTGRFKAGTKDSENISNTPQEQEECTKCKGMYGYNDQDDMWCTCDRCGGTGMEHDNKYYVGVDVAGKGSRDYSVSRKAQPVPHCSCKEPVPCEANTFCNNCGLLL